MFDEERFKVLLSDYFDESLIGRDRLAFEEALKTNSRARELFWAAAEHHALAREWALGSIGADLAASLENQDTVVDFRPMKRRKWPVAAVILAAAAVLTLAVLFLNGHPPKPSAAPVAEAANAGPIALVAMSSEARWEASGGKHLPNDTLKAGPLELRSGNVRIDFYSGTRVWIRGPASLDLVSQDEIRLKSGVLIAEVPSPAIGFKVVSDEFSITDLGTEFGAVAMGDVNEVHVFNGRVEVKGSRGGPARLLTGGQALKSTGGRWLPASADFSSFPDRAAIIEGLAYERETRFSEWNRKTAEFSRKPDLLVHYLFTPGSKDSPIANLVPGAPEMTNGTLIGGEWSTGRWERKKALSFNGISDRVKLVVPGEHRAVTFMTWMRLDDLPKQLGAVFRVEDLAPGTLRWGIDYLGRVRMGVYTPDTTFVSPEKKTPFQWDIAISKPVMGRELGHWVHLAAVYDSKKKMIELWLNGERIAMKKTKYDFPATIGVAQIGSALTLGEPEKTGRAILGRMDEFVVAGRAFTATEIRDHYRQGKPRDARNMADPAGW